MIKDRIFFSFYLNSFNRNSIIGKSRKYGKKNWMIYKRVGCVGVMKFSEFFLIFFIKFECSRFQLVFLDLLRAQMFQMNLKGRNRKIISGNQQKTHLFQTLIQFCPIQANSHLASVQICALFKSSLQVSEWKMSTGQITQISQPQSKPVIPLNQVYAPRISQQLERPIKSIPIDVP